MDLSFDILWADEARLTFDRLPADVQSAFLNHLPQLAAKYAQLYQRRTVASQVVGTVSHMQAPDWGMWLRMDIDYVEEDEPILFINELTELSVTEFNQSLRVAHSMPGRMNPPIHHPFKVWKRL